jgi:two-component system, NarL family, response regulator LiaR
MFGMSGEPTFLRFSLPETLENTKAGSKQFDAFLPQSGTTQEGNRVNTVEYQASAARSGSTTRVLLVGPWPILLSALTLLLEQYRPRLQVVGQASSYENAVEIARHSRPDVILLSMVCEGIGVAGALSALRRYGSVILLKGPQEQLPPSAAIELREARVVNAEQPAESIVQAILQAGDLRGAPQTWLHATPGMNQAKGALRKPCGKRPGLTSRERELVSALVASPGAKYLVIAEQLGISEHTVHNHLSSIYQKLHVVNRNDLLIYAVRSGVGAAHFAGPYS